MNYSTSYNINQAGDLYTIQDRATSTGLAQYTSSRGTTVNAPVNYRNLKLFRGYDNEFYFFIKSQDRKPINLQGLTLNANLIYRETGAVAVNKKCVITDYELGCVRLVVNANDLSNADTGLYDLTVSYTNDRGLTLPLFTDLNMRPTFAVDCSDDAGYIPLTTQSVSNLLTNGVFDYSDQFNGPAHYGKAGGLITIGVYATGFTGDFYLQGATVETPSASDWFDIELGVSYAYHSFSAFTGIEPFSFSSNLKYMRAKIDNTGSGTIDKIVIRV